MPHFLTSDTHPTNNPLKKAWRKFHRWDFFTQVTSLSLVLLVLATTIIVNNQFDLRQRAASAGAPPKGAMFDLRQWSWDGSTWNNGNSSGMQSDFDDARKAGITWIRFNPTTLAPSGCDPRGCFPSFTLMDQVVQMANNAGINLEILMPYVTDTNIITSWVNRYKGSIHYWEYGNEPNVESPQISASSYVQQLRTVRDAVKAADPNAVMMSAGISEWQLESYMDSGFFDTGVCSWIDVIPVHPYGGDWNGSATRYRDIASFIHGHTGCSNVPVWMNEVGFNTAGWNPNGVGSEQEKADSVVNLWNAFRSMNVPGPYFLYTQHELTNYQSGFGFEMKDQTQKSPTIFEPLFYAYQSLWAGEPIAPVFPGPGANGGGSPIPTATPRPTVAPIAGSVHVYAGTSTFIDSTGLSWNPDGAYVNGGTLDNSSNTISGTTDQRLYQPERWGAFTYNFPLSNGIYTVKLKFAEEYWSSAGQRTFNVAINGATVLSNFDILAAAGGQNRAIDKVFTTSVTNGNLQITFANGTADAPKVDAVEIIPNSTAPTVVPTTLPTLTPTRIPTPTPTRIPTPTPTQLPGITPSPPVSTGGTIRIEAGNGSSYTDPSGNLWSADSGFIGGNTVDRGTITIANTNNSRIYQTERWGMTGYSIPVANGAYTVRLHFAETNGSGVTQVGQRVFDYNVEGQQVNNFDIIAQAGATNTALVKTHYVSVADGKLTINFTEHVQATEINGIEIIPGIVQPPTPGLLGTYFSTMYLGGPSLSRVDNTINFDWRYNSPVVGMNSDNFSIRWTGYINVPTSETYTFYAKTDDGVRLWVNNSMLINKWSDHSASTAKGSITLHAGQRYPITMEYYEHRGLAVAQLSWSTPSLQRQVIPFQNLSH